MTVRHAPNVHVEVSALWYRPYQFYNTLISAQEYDAFDKIFWGTDFPFSTVANSIAGLERILHANPFAHWWHGGSPV